MLQNSSEGSWKVFGSETFARGLEGVAVVLRRSAVRLNAFLFSVREHHSNYHRQLEMFQFRNTSV